MIPLPSGVTTAEKRIAEKIAPRQCRSQKLCGTNPSRELIAITTGKRNAIPTDIVRKKTEEINSSRAKKGATPIGAANEYSIEKVRGMIIK